MAGQEYSNLKTRTKVVDYSSVSCAYLVSIFVMVLTSTLQFMFCRRLKSLTSRIQEAGSRREDLRDLRAAEAAGMQAVASPHGRKAVSVSRLLALLFDGLAVGCMSLAMYFMFLYVQQANVVADKSTAR
jgi:hypothetical protein